MLKGVPQNNEIEIENNTTNVFWEINPAIALHTQSINQI